MAPIITYRIVINLWDENQSGGPLFVGTEGKRTFLDKRIHLIAGSYPFQTPHDRFPPRSFVEDFNQVFSYLDTAHGLRRDPGTPQ